MVADGLRRGLHVAWWVCAAGMAVAQEPASPLAAESQPAIVLPAGQVLETATSTGPVEGTLAEDQQIIQHRSNALWPRLVGGADRQNVQRPAERASTGGWWDLAPLAVVLALICGAAWLVKRFLPNRKLLNGGGLVDIIARTPLTTKSSLVLVKLGRRLVLLGVTPDRVNTLATVEDADQVACLLGEAHSRRPDSVSTAFAEAFGEEAHAYAEAPDDEADGSVGVGVRGLLDKVRNMARKQS